MPIRISLSVILTPMLLLMACMNKSSVATMEKQNPLICDPDSGICELPESATASSAVESHVSKTKPIKVIYFTDPICSSCWGIEPQLRKLKLSYGHLIDIEYRMGGLLPDWSYNSGGISKPSDVAHHWDEVSQYYQMPIDGSVWLEDPLHSSYPPSIAFKAAQMQDENKAIHFLRTLREMVFLQRKNITKWAHIQQAAHKNGLDTARLRIDFQHDANTHFQNDLNLSRNLGVRGFPTLFLSDSSGQTKTIYGSKPFSVFESQITALLPQATKASYDRSWEFLFSTFETLTTREYAELSEQTPESALTELMRLKSEKKLYALDIKNGSIWSKRPFQTN